MWRGTNQTLVAESTAARKTVHGMRQQSVCRCWLIREGRIVKTKEFLNVLCASSVGRVSDGASGV